MFKSIFDDFFDDFPCENVSCSKRTNGKFERVLFDGYNVNTDNTKISIDGNVLTAVFDEKTKNSETHFKTAFTLPDNIDISTIEANANFRGLVITADYKKVLPEIKKTREIPINFEKKEV